jgi:hypothetical protein
MVASPGVRASDIVLNGKFRSIFDLPVDSQQGLGPLVYMQTASVTVSGSGANNAMVGLVLVPFKCRLVALVVDVTTEVSGALAPTVGLAADGDAYATVTGTPLTDAAVGHYHFTRSELTAGVSGMDAIPAGTAITVAHNQVSAGAARFTLILEGVQ